MELCGFIQERWHWGAAHVCSRWVVVPVMERMGGEEGCSWILSSSPPPNTLGCCTPRQEGWGAGYWEKEEGCWPPLCCVLSMCCSLWAFAHSLLCWQGVSQGPQQAVHVVLGRVVTHEADPQHLEEKGRLPLQHPPSGLVCGAHNELYGHTCEHPSLFLFSPHFFSVTIKICYPTN